MRCTTPMQGPPLAESAPMTRSSTSSIGKPTTKALPQHSRMARTLCACAVVLAVLPGCATQSPQRPLPIAWAQTNEETGKLPVGRVILVERVPFLPHGSGGTGAYAAVAPKAGVGTILVASLLTDTLSAQWVYRHTVQLRGTEVQIARDEYAAYKVGDCVAVRTTPDLLVPAAPGQCD